MLAIDPQSVPLGPAEQFALELLLDLSRVVRFVGGAEHGAADVATLRIVESDPATLRACIDSRWLLQCTDGCVTIPRGALRVVADVAGAVAEQRSKERDRYARVPSTVNALVAAGLERAPVVSLAAVALRRALLECAGRRPIRLLAPWPEGRRWAVAMSHDLDAVAPWPAFTALRLVELIRKSEIGQAASVVAAASGALLGDPIWKGVQELLAAEHEHGVRSTWFILCGTPTMATRRAGDLTYLPESRAARRIIRAVGDAQHEIGLHGSFATYDDTTRFREQRTRLERITSTAPAGVRQHYLRMRPGASQRAMSAAGFAYDSTFGFSDRNGFRLGVADVLPAWLDSGEGEWGSGEPAGIEEVPFTWMDRALSKYQGVESPQAWVEDAIELAGACRAVDGLWTGIWHPNLTAPLGFPGAQEAFRTLLSSLMRESPFAAPMSDLVSWRRVRREARARALRADGSVVLDTPSASPWPLALEDRDGLLVAQARGAHSPS